MGMHFNSYDTRSPRHAHNQRNKQFLHRLVGLSTLHFRHPAPLKGAGKYGTSAFEGKTLPQICIQL